MNNQMKNLAITKKQREVFKKYVYDLNSNESMDKRVLTKEQYNKYLNHKEHCKNTIKHITLASQFITLNDDEYWLPNYSDMLLFGIIPDPHVGFSKVLIDKAILRDN